MGSVDEFPRVGLLSQEEQGHGLKHPRNLGEICRNRKGTLKEDHTRQRPREAGEEVGRGTWLNGVARSFQRVDGNDPRLSSELQVRIAVRKRVSRVEGTVISCNTYAGIYQDS